MSRMRHEMEKRKGHAAGGDVDSEKDPKPYNAQGSNVEKEADEKARGGRAKRKSGGMIDGKEKKMRLDRPGRKTGGRVGADKAPLTTAANIRPASEHKAEDSGNADDGD